jgi:2-dehydro-3-deoxygluconokinase
VNGYDVVVLGEPLIEIATRGPITHGAAGELGVSGDVVNAAAAAAAAGARVAVVARVAADELGEAILARLGELGIDTSFVLRAAGQQGIYVQHSDPLGQRQFCYARAGSVGSTLGPQDLPLDVLATAGAVLASGITCAVSNSARAAVVQAAQTSARFIYDPNFRPRLTSATEAAGVLAELAPHSSVITPSAPQETQVLLGAESPATAVKALREVGARSVAVTCGRQGVHIDDNGVSEWREAIPAPSVEDQTGAGDVFAGTVAARLALGDSFPGAVHLAVAASSLAVGGFGGTGGIAPLERVRDHAGITS